MVPVLVLVKAPLQPGNRKQGYSSITLTRRQVQRDSGLLSKMWILQTAVVHALIEERVLHKEKDSGCMHGGYQYNLELSQ